MNDRPNRDESAHVRRRTLEDELQAGKLNMVGTPDPNKYYHVVNDDGMKVQRMIERGYVVEDGKTVNLGDANAKEVGGIAQATANPSLVGVNGKSGKAVLMSCPREFKNEDDAYRQKMVDKTEESLYRNEENQEGRYGKIKKE
ncbi:MAG: hypothetical protein OEY29_14460 [Gammaproteobacteria bacterium]|nr:hypothetical protein [Gammaproteobacteria bacterium]